METVIVVAALGAGAYYVVKRRRAKRRGKAKKAEATAVGWTAHQTGWLAGQVRLSIDKARAEARAQYERGRRRQVRLSIDKARAEARAQYERGRRIGGADTGSQHSPSI
jgi:hypothetical protein